MKYTKRNWNFFHYKDTDFVSIGCSKRLKEDSSQITSIVLKIYFGKYIFN
jgi:hypothetical protein